MMYSLICTLLLISCGGGSGGGGTAGAGAIGGTEGPAVVTAPASVTIETITYAPQESDILLSNPYMGWQTFHKFSSMDQNLASLPSSSAYYRFTWREIEPSYRQINFVYIDQLLAQAKANGQKLAFRIMSAGTYDTAPDDTPDWLQDLGIPKILYYLNESGPFYTVDMDNAIVLQEHIWLIQQLGLRYDGHPDIDIIDIGSVGLWGEWHFSDTHRNIKTGQPVSMPSQNTRFSIINAYMSAFSKSLEVMPISEPDNLAFAAQSGAGWRADCLGDIQWSHSIYPQLIQDAGAGDIWKSAPVAFETCWSINEWVQYGYNVREILDFALGLHPSYLNNKSMPLPEGNDAYGNNVKEEVQRFLKKIGYRMVLRTITHEQSVTAGSAITVSMDWENAGVAPPYKDYFLAFRLLNGSGAEVSTSITSTSVKGWAPGSIISQSAQVSIPINVTPGQYTLSVGIIDPVNNKPAIRLAIIDSPNAELWYPLTTVNILTP